MTAGGGAAIFPTPELENAIMALSIASLPETYARDGFVFPLDVVGEAAIGAIRADLEAAEAECAGDDGRLALLRSYPCRLLPSFEALIRGPAIIEAVRPILGPDLVVWSSALFIKEANSA